MEEQLRPEAHGERGAGEGEHLADTSKPDAGEGLQGCRLQPERGEGEGG